MSTKFYKLFIVAIAFASLVSAKAFAEIQNFYIAVDSREEIHFGDYLGLPNPNKDRLTFLYAHQIEDPSSNHFHGIGVHFYEGDPADATTTTTNGNNRIPEGFTGQAPLTLQPGTDGLSGLLVSGENGEHYSDLTLHPVHDLSGFGDEAPETYMFNSGAMGYQAPLTGLDLSIELVSISPGLALGTEGLSNPGEKLQIGTLQDLPFQPLFWTDESAEPGTYSAEFRLVDESGTFLPSGTINVDFAVPVPEPSSLLLGLAGVMALVSLRHRVRKS